MLNFFSFQLFLNHVSIGTSVVIEFHSINYDLLDINQGEFDGQQFFGMNAGK